jgi:predicted AAA+ superfamily ATPase
MDHNNQFVEQAEYNQFVEQAEYIDDDSFNKWNIEHPNEEAIIKKLSQGGAKLIIGPRGCGKTTLMRKTCHKLCFSKSSKTLPIYVNFKSSLKLEPFYVKEVNAVF